MYVCQAWTQLLPASVQIVKAARPRSGGSTTGHAWITALCIAIGALFALPGTFVLIRTITLSSDIVGTLNKVWGPLGRTLLLATCVAATTAIIGTTLAWLLIRTDLPGRNVWRVVLVLPLVLPSFVGAAAFLAALAPQGILHQFLDLVGIDPPTSFRGFLPAWFVLSAFTYPYVLLPVSARLLALRPSLEESARLLGRSTPGVFLQITLPQIRSSILTGALLVFLYTVSDFGAVQLLGYDTLTRVIEATRLSNRSVSFAAASILIALAVAAVASERNLRSDSRPDDLARSQLLTPLSLGRWKGPALALCVVVSSLGLIVPIASLSTWALRGLLDGRVPVADLIRPALNTAAVGVTTAVCAVTVVLPVAALSIRHRSKAASISSIAVIGGFAVPGIVIALSLVFWTLNVPGMDILYQTFPLLIIAYVIHFGSQAMGAAEVAIRAVPPQLRESARLLSPSGLRNFIKIDMPLMRPSLTSGAGLVLLSTIKELPATLILSPIGFRTLSTKIWGSYEDGYYAEVGVTSLILITLSAGLTWVLVLSRTDALNRTRRDQP